MRRQERAEGFAADRRGASGTRLEGSTASPKRVALGRTSLRVATRRAAVAVLALLSAAAVVHVPTEGVANVSSHPAWETWETWDTVDVPEHPLDESAPRATTIAQVFGSAWGGGSHGEGSARAASEHTHVHVRAAWGRTGFAPGTGPLEGARRIPAYRATAPPGELV